MLEHAVYLGSQVIYITAKDRDSGDFGTAGLFYQLTGTERHVIPARLPVYIYITITGHENGDSIGNTFGFGLRFRFFDFTESGVHSIHFIVAFSINTFRHIFYHFWLYLHLST